MQYLIPTTYYLEYKNAKKFASFYVNNIGLDLTVDIVFSKPNLWPAHKILSAIYIFATVKFSLEFARQRNLY